MEMQVNYLSLLAVRIRYLNSYSAGLKFIGFDIICLIICVTSQNGEIISILLTKLLTLSCYKIILYTGRPDTIIDI